MRKPRIGALVATVAMAAGMAVSGASTANARPVDGNAIKNSIRYECRLFGGTFGLWEDGFYCTYSYPAYTVTHYWDEEGERIFRETIRKKK